jgi:hypothetical protein
MYPGNQPVETVWFTSAVAASMLKTNLCCAAIDTKRGEARSPPISWLAASNLLSAFYFSIPQHMSLNSTGCVLAELEICPTISSCQPDFSRF